MKEKKQEFLTTYEDQCICYLLSIMERLRINKKDKTRIVFENRIIRSDIEINYNLPFAIERFPFYVSLYNKYGNLYTLMEKCAQRGLVSINIGNEKRSKMRKGLYNYKKLSQEEKKNFLNELLRGRVKFSL